MRWLLAERLCCLVDRRVKLTLDHRSGSNVDVCVIEKGRTENLRNYRRPNERASKDLRYVPRVGATAVSKEEVWKLVVASEVQDLPQPPAPPAASTAMEVDA